VDADGKPVPSTSRLYPDWSESLRFSSRMLQMEDHAEIAQLLLTELINTELPGPDLRKTALVKLLD
jgi:hypothetical protein